MVSHPSRKTPTALLSHHDTPVSGARLEVAADLLLELAIPFRGLTLRTDERVQFYFELIKDKESIERIPHEGAIETAVPSPDYELIMWQA